MLSVYSGMILSKIIMKIGREEMAVLRQRSLGQNKWR